MYLPGAGLGTALPHPLSWPSLSFPIIIPCPRVGRSKREGGLGLIQVSGPSWDGAMVGRGWGRSSWEEAGPGWALAMALPPHGPAFLGVDEPALPPGDNR